MSDKLHDDAVFDPALDETEDALFQKIKAKMETEVSEMHEVATRRGFLQKIAASSAIVPASIVMMASDSCGDGTVDICWTDCCFVACQSCVTDGLCEWVWKIGCPNCLNCDTQLRWGCSHEIVDGGEP